MNVKECYQVMVEATMTNELRALYENLGNNLFIVEQVSPIDYEITEPELLGVKFDICNSDKITFDVYVELPIVDDSVLPLEFRIGTTGHINPFDIITFTVFPLPSTVVSRAYKCKDCKYEIYKIDCAPVDGVTNPPVTDPTGFRMTFPLKKEIACLIPEFGLSGFYLKNLVETDLKTKVRLCPIGLNYTSDSNAQVVGALLTYDTETCTACLEFNPEQHECVKENYEYLFSDDETPPSLETMVMAKRFAIKGVSKCTDTVLFSFEICYKPLLMSQTLGYKLSTDKSKDHILCYEFY